MRSKLVWIRGPLKAGCKVLRQAPPGVGRWPKEFRYYNPDGAPFEMQVELDHWIQLLVRDGEVEVFKPAATKPADAAAAKPARKADKE